MSESPPQALVALGSGDGATDAALVAGKSGIRLLTLLDDDNGLVGVDRALAELSSDHFTLPEDNRDDIARAAVEIAAKLA